MTKDEIIAKVKELDLPAGSFVVFGGSPLAVAGLREANDIDLLVTQEVYDDLKDKGWQEIEKGPNDKALSHGVFEAHNNWDFSFYNPTLKDLLVNAVEIDGIQFASIDDVRKWKEASGRTKDIRDIELIDRYLET
ncbi:MAG: hypothetical protein WAN50_05130 [Minisyncoccia bacterium]